MWIKKAWWKTNYLSGGFAVIYKPILCFPPHTHQQQVLKISSRAGTLFFLFFFFFFPIFHILTWLQRESTPVPLLHHLSARLPSSFLFLSGCLWSPAVTSWHQYQIQESSPWVPAWAFLLCNDTQWLAVNPPAKTVLRAHPKETQESINTPCPCLLSGPDCARATSPGSLTDLFGPHLREAHIARSQTLFPRALKCFALPFHHGWNELVPIAPPLLHPLPH